MSHYMICNQADEEIYKKQCVALENNIPGIRKYDELEDVDGSLIQEYYVGGDRLTVHNSYYLNEVYIKTDIDLDKYFS